MTLVSAIVTVIENEGEARGAELDIPARPGFEPLPFELFAPWADLVSVAQLVEIHALVNTLRRTFSGALLNHVVLHRMSEDKLRRIQIWSDAEWARVKDGGVMIAVVRKSGFQGDGLVGHPITGAMAAALRNAFGEAVARLQRLGLVADRADYEIYENSREDLLNALQTRESLFNLTEFHIQEHSVSVLDWCEEHGGKLLATAHGLEETDLDRALEAAFLARLRHRSFETVLDDELVNIDTLIAWSGSLVEHKEGNASRRDTTRRLLAENGLDWDTAPGAVEPPTLSNKVRRKIVAEQGMAALSPHAMVEAAFMFDLKPVHDLFPTRLFLTPVLASAGLAGRIGMRRQPGAIADLWDAAGSISLAETLLAQPVAAPGDGEPDGDELDTVQNLVRRMLGGAGLSVHELAVKGHGFLQTDQEIPIDPPPGPRLFFVED